MSAWKRFLIASSIVIALPVFAISMALLMHWIESFKAGRLFLWALLIVPFLGIGVYIYKDLGGERK